MGLNPKKCSYPLNTPKSAQTLKKRSGMAESVSNQGFAWKKCYNGISKWVPLGMSELGCADGCGRRACKGVAGNGCRWGWASLAARTAADGKWVGRRSRWRSASLPARTAADGPHKTGLANPDPRKSYVGIQNDRDLRKRAPSLGHHFVRDFLRKRKMEELLCCNGHQKRRTRTSNEHRALINHYGKNRNIVWGKRDEQNKRRTLHTQRAQI